ncbi:MAG: DNA-directed RNA polymerase subunit omega [Candidatus Acidiferrales bacterium]
MAVMKEPPQGPFAYVSLVSKRARQLMLGARPLLDSVKSRKPTRLAEEELQLGLLDYDLLYTEENENEVKDEKRRK